MATEYKDYYKVLGVSRDADTKAIRQAFRKLARQYHPDVNPDNKTAEERFKEVNEAHEVLSDPEKRQKYNEMLDYYNRYGHWPGAAQGGRPSGATAGAGTGGGYRYRTISEEDFEDLFGGRSPFSDFFETYFHSGFGADTGRTGFGRATGGGRAGYTQPTLPGEDVESTIEVTLAEAYQGATRTFELTEADGTSRRLEVKIPAGVAEGSRIRIAKQGMQGRGGRGDLYLRVHLLPDSRFRLEGNDLHTAVDVPLVTAMLGGEVQVATPDGRRLLLRIPTETPNGKSFRLRGQGMPQLGKTEQRGDLYADISVVLPTHLTAEQKKKFEDFAHSLEQ